MGGTMQNSASVATDRGA